jgi:deoxycytidylate deaminase
MDCYCTTCLSDRAFDKKWAHESWILKAKEDPSLALLNLEDDSIYYEACPCDRCSFQRKNSGSSAIRFVKKEKSTQTSPTSSDPLPQRETTSFDPTDTGSEMRRAIQRLEDRMNALETKTHLVTQPKQP